MEIQWARDTVHLLCKQVLQAFHMFLLSETHWGSKASENQIHNGYFSYILSQVEQ